MRWKQCSNLSGTHREVMPITEGVGCRLSEDEKQLHEMSWLHVGAQRQRGISWIIEEEAQGASPLPVPVCPRVFGELTARCFERVLLARAASAKPRWRSGVHQRTRWEQRSGASDQRVTCREEGSCP